MTTREEKEAEMKRENIADLPIDWAGGYGCGSVDCPAFNETVEKHPGIILPFHGFLSHCMGCRRFRGFKYSEESPWNFHPVAFVFETGRETARASHVRCMEK